MKRWMRRISLCLIFLSGGAITTVAVAWACAILINPFGLYTAQDEDVESKRGVRYVRDPWGGLWLVVRRRAPGILLIYVAFERDGAWLSMFSKDDDAAALLPEWTGLLTPSAQFLAGERNYECTGIDARGWPMVSMWHVEKESYTTPDARGRLIEAEARGGMALPLPEWSDPLGVRPRTLPLRIVPLGFAVNTLFYALIWLGVFFGFASAKRAIRRRRGRCPMCGYDLRGQLAAGCPECGWNRYNDKAESASDVST